jgi:hypothetical protein
MGGDSVPTHTACSARLAASALSTFAPTPPVPNLSLWKFAPVRSSILVRVSRGYAMPAGNAGHADKREDFAERTSGRRFFSLSISVAKHDARWVV